jgi:zinc transporter ZupT
MKEVIYFSFLTSIFVLTGAILPVYLLKETRKIFLYRFLAFTSGVLIATSFLEILPQSAGLDISAMGEGLLFSFVLLFSLEKFLLLHICPEEDKECETHSFTSIAVLSLFFHGTLDGVVLSSGLAISFSAGFVIFIAISLHKIPAGISAGTLFLNNGNRKKAILLAALFALSTPFGALLSYSPILNMPTSTFAFILGVSAGNLLYLGATDILPRIHEKRDTYLILLFILGILIILTATKFLPL